jgi:formate hydrogenlyase subunit 4
MDILTVLVIVLLVAVVIGWPSYGRTRLAAGPLADLVVVIVVIVLLAVLFGAPRPWFR